MNEEFSTTSVLTHTDLTSLERENLLDALIVDLMRLPHLDRRLIVNMASLIESLDSEGIVTYAGGNPNSKAPTEFMNRAVKYIHRFMAFTPSERDEIVYLVNAFAEDGINPIIDD